MSFSDMGVQLIEVMNSKRSSPRTKQRPSSEQSKGTAAQPLQPSTPKAARRSKADLLAADSERAALLSADLGAGLDAENTLSSAELLVRMTTLASQMLGAMTTLTLQFQQQQQQNLQLNQLLAQVLQALIAETSAESSVRSTVSGSRSGAAIAKDSFAILNSKDLKKSHAKGSAEEKLRRAFQAIVAHNEESERPHADKWAVNQNALAELTGCNRPAIKQFLKQYGSEIEVHHQIHALMPRHNYAHGKVGTKITDIIRW